MKYEIKGEPFGVVICSLEAEESMVAESGAMSWMSPNMEMTTTSGGGAGKIFGRLFAGEHIFQNHYAARGGPGTIAFTSSFPGSIRAVEVTPDRPVVIQKSAFLASEEGVDLNVFFQEKIKTGFFGGEGFIMQKLTGSGMAFLEIDGSTIEYDLAPGQQILVSSGHLAMMDATCTMDVRQIKGVKNVLFGGEGLFNTVITGPGHVILQTMPMSDFAMSLYELMPSSSSSN